MGDIATFDIAQANSSNESRRLSGAVLLAFAALLVVPPVVYDLTVGAGIFGKILAGAEERNSPNNFVNLGKYRVTFSPMLVGLFLPASVLIAARASLRRKERGQLHCGLVLKRICIAFLIVGVVLPLLGNLVPWKSLGIPPWPNLYLTALLNLYWVEGLLIVPHLLSIVGIWIVQYRLACRLIHGATSDLHPKA